MRRLIAVVAVSLCGIVASCGNRAPLPEEPAEREAELRLRVATDPTDRASQRELGRLYASRDVKSAAIRHLRAAHSARSKRDSQTLAGLLVSRAAFRLEFQDAAAIEDLELAAQLGQPAPPELMKRALGEQALAAFRRGDPKGLAEGRRVIAEWGVRFGEGPARAVLNPDLAAVPAVGAAALWLEDGGAFGAARIHFRNYRHRGGADSEVLAGSARIERWWGTVPEEPPSFEDELTTSIEQWLTLKTNGWPSDRAHQLARVDSLGLAEWATPTFHRLRGERKQARTALILALSSFDDREPAQQAVLLCEVAAIFPDGPAMPTGRGALPWLAIKRAKRAGVRAAKAAVLPADVPASIQRIDHVLAGSFEKLATTDPAARYALARHWSSLPSGAGEPPAGSTELWVAPLGTVDPVRAAIDVGDASLAPALTEIAQAFGRDPALAERRAQAWIDDAIAPHRRGPAVVMLLARAGDPGLARVFAERLLENSPDHPAFLALAAVRSAAAGDSARAGVLAHKAASRSGDAGRVLRELTAQFTSVGAHLLAISIGKRALSLSAPQTHDELRVHLYRAMTAIDRTSDAAAMVPNSSRKARDSGGELSGLAWNPNDPDLLLRVALGTNEPGAGKSLPSRAEAGKRLARLALYASEPDALLSWAELLEKTGRQKEASAARREAQSRIEAR